MRKFNLFWRVDNQIRADKVRVIDDKGKQLGVLPLAEALGEAKKAGLTLVEIAPNAKPPVCKIVEFGKFRYREEKKLRSQQKKAKASELKEIRFSPFIAENDFQTRFGRVKEFLGEKDKVRLVVVFRGPQLRSKQFGYDLLKRMVRELGDSITVDMEPKFLGKHLIMIVSPLSRPKKKEEIKETKEETKKEIKNENKKE